MNLKLAAIAASVLGIAAVVQGCGGNNGTPPPGYLNSGLGCYGTNCSGLSPAQRIEAFDACAAGGGEFVLLNENGFEVRACRTQTTFTYTINSGHFPELSVESPQSLSAFATPIRLLRGDRVLLSAKGNQGLFSGNEVLGALTGGILGEHCDGPDTSGKLDDHSVNGADSRPAGLFGTLQDLGGNRSTPFLIGNRYDLGVVPNDATLVVGWNKTRLESEPNAPLCQSKLSRVSAKIIRCVDSAGNSYQCPR